MQIGPDQGALMTLLTRLTGARSAVEVGTFTGYSAICIARGLAEGGKLTCCDVSEDWTSLAREYWQRAGLADRIELRLGPALDTLRALPPARTWTWPSSMPTRPATSATGTRSCPGSGRAGSSWSTTPCRAARWPTRRSPSRQVTGMRAFNDHAAADPRVDLVLLPVGDGLTLARRR